MIEERFQVYADKFFQLIRDHGRFNRLQLIRYVEMKTGETLSATDCALLLGYAHEKGAKREPKSLAPVYQMPVDKRPTARAQRQHTLELVK